MSRKVILLIDDDHIFLMLTKRLLQNQPYLERIDTSITVDEAFAYFQALEEAKGSPFPDAVFIDLDMPQIDGLELAKQLKDKFLEGRQATKLYILSSSISQRDRQKAEDTDYICDYIEKPLSPDVLRLALDVESQQPKARNSISTSMEQQKQEEGRESKPKASKEE